MHTQADKEEVRIDATIVRSHACSAGYKKESHMQEAWGKSKGGLTPKIHAVVDALGQALCLTLTPGQRKDLPQPSQLWKEVMRKSNKKEMLEDVVKEDWHLKSTL